MYNLWGKIAAADSSVIWKNESKLTRLEWVEVEEAYPQFVPDSKRGYDVYSDDRLIHESPFERSVNEKTGKPEYYFRMKVPRTDFELTGMINYRQLINLMTRAEHDREILTCGCSEPGCAGFWEEYFHVSEKMVHWAIHKYEIKCDLFFEREAYEENVLRMLRDLVENESGWDNLGVPSFIDFEQFRDHVMWMLDRRPYYHDMWDEVNELEKRGWEFQ